MKKGLLAMAICLGTLTTVNAQKLDKFGADLAKKSMMGKEIRVPYTDLTSYFGYIKPGSKPDEVKNGKKMYYVYVWVPVAAPEIGIRMISPVPDSAKPSDKDYVSADYTANASDTKNFFDTWVTFERAEGIFKLEDVAAKAKTAKWTTLDSNDDSGEMPAQPSGSKYNSLMRITSEPSNPTKAIVMGLYRIGFTTYKTGEVQGSFMAQLGAPVKLPGVAVAVKPEDLAKAAK
ncbi:Lipl32 family lipoprotein [Flavobacterium sp. SUN046]|uniref:Lipl32 family lipoprotein n=1 Tax=Flavobacterium sp. SUN046 TaxID=3002440 RepID=UPI002DB71ECB|nr:Lipl32 family lipoprotein [Flavobacterium sp. SUN046]MEC4050647.1 Lipl32 family lipoprotein [Flavobacterium sp. SUN046]